MDQLRDLILQLCSAERTGGRVQVYDSETLALVDCMNWKHCWTDLLTQHYPTLELSIKSSRQSLSGYIVCFRVARPRVHFGWHLAVGLILGCCLTVLLMRWSARGEPMNI